MTDINLKIFELFKRQPLVTEYIVFPQTTSNIKDYQIKLPNVPSLSKLDATVISNKKIMDYWIESKGTVWVKIPNLLANTPMKIYVLTGNQSNIYDNELGGRRTFDIYNGGWLTGWNNNSVTIDPWTKEINIASNTTSFLASQDLVYRPAIVEYNLKYTPATSQFYNSLVAINIHYGTQGQYNQLGFHANQYANNYTVYTNAATSTFVQFTTVNSSYHKYKIIWIDSSTAKFYLDDVLLSSPASNYPTNTSFYIYFGGTDIATYAMTLNSIRTRKYVANEPVVKKIRTINRLKFLNTIW